MDFDKLKEFAKNTMLSEDTKGRLVANCVAAERLTAERRASRRRFTPAKAISALCAIAIIVSVSVWYSGVLSERAEAYALKTIDLTDPAVLDTFIQSREAPVSLEEVCELIDTAMRIYDEYDIITYYFYTESKYDWDAQEYTPQERLKSTCSTYGSKELTPENIAAAVSDYEAAEKNEISYRSTIMKICYIIDTLLDYRFPEGTKVRRSDGADGDCFYLIDRTPEEVSARLEEIENSKFHSKSLYNTEGAIWVTHLWVSLQHEITYKHETAQSEGLFPTDEYEKMLDDILDVKYKSRDAYMEKIRKHFDELYEELIGETAE